MLNAARDGDWYEAQESARDLARTCNPFWRPLYEALTLKYAKDSEIPAIEPKEAGLTEIIHTQWSI